MCLDELRKITKCQDCKCSSRIWVKYLPRHDTTRNKVNLGEETKNARKTKQRIPIDSLYGCTTFCWALAAFSVSWYFTQSVGLLWRGISPSQGRYLHTGQHKQWIKFTHIQASSGIRTQDPSVRGGEDGSCLRPRATQWSATVDQNGPNYLNASKDQASQRPEKQEKTASLRKRDKQAVEVHRDVRRRGSHIFLTQSTHKWWWGYKSLHPRKIPGTHFC
jgi:hypothetical protein